MSTKIVLLNVKVLAIPGATEISANDINDHGQVVGQFTDSHGIAHGFLYEEESYCQIDYPEATSTNLLGINNLGQIVGMITTGTGTSGFFYDRGTFGPPMMYPGAANLTVANALNDRGEIVGVYQDAVGTRSFLYKAGRFSPILFPGASESSAEAINNSGQVVGEFPDAKGTHGFIYLENAGVFAPPLDCPKSNMALRGINNGGQMVGGCIDSQGMEQPFLYMAAAMNMIAIPGATSAIVNGINDRGQIVGNYSSRGLSQPFIAVVPS